MRGYFVITHFAWIGWENVAVYSTEINMRYYLYRIDSEANGVLSRKLEWGKQERKYVESLSTDQLSNIHFI